MAYVDFITSLHKSTKRDYLERVVSYDKAKCAETAKKFDCDYWDGDRRYGYGGYKYDGRWRPVAQKIADYYNLKNGSKVLDIGCGKGFLLYELTNVVEGLIVKGIDISQYAIDNSKEEIRNYLQVAKAQELPFKDEEFDLAISITTLHNLYLYDLFAAIKEMKRVSKKAYINVEAYRSEQEKVNLMYWQLTCECFFTPQEWEFIFNQCGYANDYEFIFFE